MPCLAVRGLALALALVVFGCTGKLQDGGAGPSGTAGSGGTGFSGGDDGKPVVAQDGSVVLESVARRLSQAELDNVLRDVLGDQSRPASRLLIEDEFAPYDNDYTLQRASQALIDGLEALSEDVAQRLLSDPAARDLVMPCTPSGPDDTACFRETIETLGRRLFRRALTEQEIEAYLTLQSFATEDNDYVDNDFYTAVELFLRSALQDPEVLYRIEIGSSTGTAGVHALGSHEIASRLSFLIWGSAPDEQLLALADQDGLSSAQARAEQARRLLGDERARDQLHRFHAMWLGYRAIPNAPELVAAFDTETTALIDRVVFDEGRDYLDLFTLDETYADALLAENYGLAPPEGGGWDWVGYGTSGRAGILSHGSVLASFSKFSDTSPTQRGLLVTTRLLCRTVQPPPANVNVDAPPGDGSAVCKYDRYAEHRAIASCAQCHDPVDKIGFGLENYDIDGRYRTHDDGLPECTIEGVGELGEFGSFSGPGELGRLLVESGALDDCSLEQYLSFASGRRLQTGERPAIEAAVARFESKGRSFADVIVDWAASDAFAYRREPAP